MRYSFRSNSDGYDIQFGESFSHISWDDLLRVEEKSHYFLFYLTKYEVTMIPKSAFEPTAISMFRAIIASKLKDGAKLKGGSN